MVHPRPAGFAEKWRVQQPCGATRAVVGLEGENPRTGVSTGERPKEEVRGEAGVGRPEVASHEPATTETEP